MWAKEGSVGGTRVWMQFHLLEREMREDVVLRERGEREEGRAGAGSQRRLWARLPQREPWGREWGEGRGWRVQRMAHPSLGPPAPGGTEAGQGWPRGGRVLSQPGLGGCSISDEMTGADWVPVQPWAWTQGL